VDTGSFLPALKQQGHETGHSPVPISRKRGSIHPLPNTSSRRSAKVIKHRDNLPLQLIKHRANFTSTVNKALKIINIIERKYTGFSTIYKFGLCNFA
jgi:hypothetical protein